jgi:hypothetical protein
MYSIPRVFLLFVQLANQTPLLHPDALEMNQPAPVLFKVRLKTSKGDVLIEVHRDWSPRGVDHF